MIDYSAPFSPNQGIGDRQRATAGFLDAISHDRPRRPRRPTHDPATTPQSLPPQSLPPQSKTPQSTNPQFLAHPESSFPNRVSPTRFDRQAVPTNSSSFPDLR